MCGGTSCAGLLRMSDPGLSPRVRGNPRWGPYSNAVLRSIPACAGEPARTRSMESHRRVYPRVCGGTVSSVSADALRGGLSPRVRGNLILGGCQILRPRSIPACAGEPDTGSVDLHCDPVYPRVCGGTDAALSRFPSRTGLSPRVRGNRMSERREVRIDWSIPACAGEPHRWLSFGLCSRVYPRVCGGTTTSSAVRKADFGLSPRVRGNRPSLPRLDSHVRSIPACAGEPWVGTGRRTPRTVYPRVCGGTVRQRIDGLVIEGLSPRVRGNQMAVVVDEVVLRSIPACAGEPGVTYCEPCCGLVYPRVCGGTLPTTRLFPPSEGLSPRVRGNHRQHGLPTTRLWSIPACAGEPGVETAVGRRRRVYPRVCGGTRLTR